MKVFATGGSGYAGYHACLELAAHGHEVTTISRDPDKPRLARLREAEIDVREGSVGDPDTYRGIVDGSDVVLHSVMDFDEPVEADRRLFRTLREAAPRPGGRRRLIYTTGCSILGRRPERVMDENTPGNPDHALHFRMELEREALALMPDTGVVCVRPGFMYGGAGQSSIAGMWFAMGLDGEAVYRGDPDKGWSWVHVSDLARAYRLVAEADRGVDGETYDVADESRQTCVAVMRACLDAAGHDGEVRFEGPDEEDRTSTWFDQNEFVTSAKARMHLGWVPKHTGVVDEAPRHFAAWRAARESAS